MAGILLLSSSRNAQCSSLCMIGTASSRPTIKPRCPAGSDAIALYPRSVVNTPSAGWLITLVITAAPGIKSKSGRFI